MHPIAAQSVRLVRVQVLFERALPSALPHLSNTDWSVTTYVRPPHKKQSAVDSGGAASGKFLTATSGPERMVPVLNDPLRGAVCDGDAMSPDGSCYNARIKSLHRSGRATSVRTGTA